MVHIKNAIYGKMFKGESFRGLCSFSLNRECFPTNYGLVDWQCKFTSMLAQSFPVTVKWQFCTLTAKVFPLKSFDVYGSNYQPVEELIH